MYPVFKHLRTSGYTKIDFLDYQNDSQLFWRDCAFGMKYTYLYLYLKFFFAVIPYLYGYISHAEKNSNKNLDLNEVCILCYVYRYEIKIITLFKTLLTYVWVIPIQYNSFLCESHEGAWNLTLLM
jgi:hypothetical protein